MTPGEAAGGTGAAAHEARRGRAFDLPLLLSGAFWASLGGVVLEKTVVLLGLFGAGGAAGLARSCPACAVGPFLLNLGSLLSVLLAGYYVAAAVRGGRGHLRFAAVSTGACFVATALVIVVGALAGKPTVLNFLSAHVLALGGCGVVVATSLGGGGAGKTLALLPVLALIFFLVNRLSFFFPALVPALPGTALSIASLHAGQALMLLFMALAALRAARWNARLSLPRFVPFLASLSLVVALAAPWAASGRTRTMIGRLAELQCVLPTSFALFALAVGACVLAVSMLLARDLRAPWLQPARDRSAYALGFLMMSALVPFTFHEIAMIVVGLLAWNHALQGSDGEGIASPSS